MTSTLNNLNIIRETLSKYGTGRRGISDDLFKNCPVNKVYSEPVNVAEIYPEDFATFDDSDSEYPCHVLGCTEVSKSIKDADSHYNSAHRHTCSQCKKSLPTAHLLDLHLSEVHDSFFAVLSKRKPSYACYIAECPTKFNDSDERITHCIKIHKFPANFRYGIKDKKNLTNAEPTESPTSDIDSSTTQNMDIISDDKKPYAHFSFGRSQAKTFGKPSSFNKKSTYEMNALKSALPDITNRSVSTDAVMDDLSKNLTDDMKTV